MSRSFNVAAAQTTELHLPDIGFQTTLFGKVLLDVQTTWQHIRKLLSVPKYFGSPYGWGKEWQRW
jgi:hypothetical protein